MAFSADYKGLVRQFSIILFIVLTIYLALVRPVAKQGVNLLQDQINEALVQLERYIPKEGGLLPTKESVRVLEAYLAQERQNYQDLRNFIDPPREYLPRGTQEQGLYFIEQLHIATKRLKRQANTLKIKIPDSFGFSKEMPEDAGNVQILLEKLDVVERVTTLLMEQGVEEISLARPLGMLEQRDSRTQELFYRELPFQLSFLCNSSTLVRILYQMKTFSPALIVKDIIIRREKGTSLQIKVLLSRLMIP